MPDLDYCDDVLPDNGRGRRSHIDHRIEVVAALDLDRVKSLLRHPVVIDLRNIYQAGRDDRGRAHLSQHRRPMRPLGSEPMTETPAGLRAIA